MIPSTCSTYTSTTVLFPYYGYSNPPLLPLLISFLPHIQTLYFLVLFHFNGKPVLFFVYIPKSSPASSSPFDYQPISLLSLASKLLEKTTFWQRNPYFLLNFINCFSFLFCNFFRFLKSHKPHIHLSLCICITNNIYIFSIWFSSQPLNHFCSTVFTPFFSL